MAKFKVGDTVRFVKGNALADATGIIVGNGDGYYAWSVRLDKRSVDFGHTCDGLIDDFFGRYAKDADLELITATPQLTIRAGHYYRTRDGRKVGPVKESGGLYGAPGFYDHEWYNTGRVYSTGEEHDKDLIAEWIDEPAFKVGDRVKFVDDYGGRSRGKEATVVKLNVWGEGKGVQVDQGCMYGIDSGERLWVYTDTVKPVESPPTAIVCLIENGQPKPATRPFVHPDRDSAAKEARRLAGQHKGKEFGVYELVDTTKEAKVYEHEWQRLAANKKTGDAAKEMRKLTGLSLGDSKRAVERWLGKAA